MATGATVAETVVTLHCKYSFDDHKVIYNWEHQIPPKTHSISMIIDKDRQNATLMFSGSSIVIPLAPFTNYVLLLHNDEPWNEKSLQLDFE